MRNSLLLLSILFSSFLFIQTSCRSSDKKTTPANNTVTIKDTTQTKNAQRPSDDRIPSDNGQSTTTNNNNIISSSKLSKDDILANIDQYIVSTPNIPNPGNTGITNASVTVKNTLPDITIQKAIIEVSILTADGAEFRTDYYILQNIEPNEVETIKIPNAARGNSIVSHVVKIKSQELTNGEMITVGHRVTPK